MSDQCYRGRRRSRRASRRRDSHPKCHGSQRGSETSIHGDAPFFEVTKAFHNALQGADLDLTETVKQLISIGTAPVPRSSKEPMTFTSSMTTARCFATLYQSEQRAWIWRCHIDSSQPNPQVWTFLKPFIEEYDAVVFTMEEFRPPDLKASRVVFIPPAIDPLSTKNMALPEDVSKAGCSLSPLSIFAVPCFFRSPGLIHGRTRWASSTRIVW